MGKLTTEHTYICGEDVHSQSVVIQGMVTNSSSAEVLRHPVPIPLTGAYYTVFVAHQFGATGRPWCRGKDFTANPRLNHMSALRFAFTFELPMYLVIL